MNCRQAERLCSYRRDHALTTRQQQVLQQHLAHCADCCHKEHGYHKIVTALESYQSTVTDTDIISLAIERREVETSMTTAPQSLHRNILFGKEKRSMLRLGTAAILVTIIAGTVLLETRPQQALGQASLRQMHASVLKAKTVHLVTWAFLQSEAEAKTGTWQKGKKPIRLETWMTRQAMRGTDKLNGPYLWTKQGYLHYDRETNQILTIDPGPEVTLKASIDNAFNPLAKIQQSAPTGTYLSVKRLDKTRWQGRDVYRLQITSGPNKPALGEEMPVEPGAKMTPPVSQGPNIRETFWVDQRTNLPLYSESEKQLQGQWVMLKRNEYDYNCPISPKLLNPASVRKELETVRNTTRKIE